MHKIKWTQYVEPERYHCHHCRSELTADQLNGISVTTSSNALSEEVDLIMGMDVPSLGAEMVRIDEARREYNDALRNDDFINNP